MLPLGCREHVSSQPASAAKRRLAFGPFTFDDTTGELKKHGSPLRLQGQPLQVLRVFAKQPGDVILRDEFQRLLWDSSTFVDFEHGLNAAMNRLRQVLGDSAEQPRYIETVAGRGYRFIAPVHETLAQPLLLMSPAPGVEQPSPSQALAPRWRKRAWAQWILAGILLAGLVGGVYWTFTSPRANSGPALRYSISPPNGYALEAGSSRQTFALSPDGRRLAFTAMDASGTGHMFIRDLDEIDARPLANSAGAYHVFWAPDGRSLFLTVRGSLRRSGLNDDSFQVVCDTPPRMLTGVVLGSNLLISGRSTDFVVPVSGGQPKAVQEFYPWPQVLPDGQHLVYTVPDAPSGHHRVRVVKLGQPETVRDLLESDSRAMYAPSGLQPGSGYLVYVRAGNILAQEFDPRSLRIQGEPIPLAARTYSFSPTGAADFSVSNNGALAYRRYQSRSQLAWVNRQGQVVKTIGPANINVKQGRLSPDGARVATSIFNVDRGANEIWLIDTATGASRQLIAGPGLAENPVWAPDSARLVFNRASATPPKLFLRGLGEADAEEPLPKDYFQLPGDWSRDGRFIAFTNTGFAIENELKGDVWLIDMARGRKTVQLIRTPFHEANPAFSPDGRWLAFTSNESGRAELYLQAFEAGDAPRLIGERRLVSQHGAVALRWRPDGRELFYLAWDGQLHAVPITLSGEPRIAEAAPLFTIALEARAALHSMVGFDVSADGQRLLVPIVTSSERSEIVVVQNWEAEARRRQRRSN